MIEFACIETKSQQPKCSLRGAQKSKKLLPHHLKKATHIRQKTKTPFQTNQILNQTPTPAQPQTRRTDGHTHILLGFLVGPCTQQQPHAVRVTMHGCRNQGSPSFLFVFGHLTSVRGTCAIKCTSTYAVGIMGQIRITHVQIMNMIEKERESARTRHIEKEIQRQRV